MFFSLKMLIFIVTLLIAYYVMPDKWKYLVLLGGSFVFYVMKGRLYLIYLLLVTIISFYAAKKIEKWGSLPKEQRTEAKKKQQLLVGMIVCILVTVLAVFKYQPIADRFSILLPIGISYYTFMIIGYLIDVYRMEYPAEQNLLHYMLFVTYFPALIQGPINRFEYMRQQFFCKHPLRWENIRNGAWLFLWGLFKKMVIADRCAIFVKEVMGEKMETYSGSLILTSVIFFVVQMYGDFSGGIDMAEGISEMFGIKMAQNFRQPFFATSIGEFWRRWHMSLGNWIKDYVFYQIAFSKAYNKFSKHLTAILGQHLGTTIPAMFVSIFTFLLIGIWHGINPTYVCYGLWYGFMVGFSGVIAPYCEKFCSIFFVRTDVASYRMLQRIRTWIIVLVGESLCILPRLGSFQVVCKKILMDFRYYECFYGLFEGRLKQSDFLIIVIALSIWLFVSVCKEKGIVMRAAIAEQNLWCRYMLTWGIIVAIALFGIYGPQYDAVAFIYGGI